MCALFRNKYRIESDRYHGYDYSSPGKYFITICTITIKTRGFDFAWQPRYYDHIIRTRIELYRIRKYIRENPEKLIRNSQNIQNSG